MAKKPDPKRDKIKANLGDLFARTEPAPEETTEEPPITYPPVVTRPAVVTPPPTVTPTPTAEPEHPDHVLAVLEAELRRSGLSGHELDRAVTAFRVAQATQEADRLQRRDRRDWSQVAREHGKPQTFRLWQTTINRLEELSKRYPTALKRDLVNALLAYALDAAEAGELDLDTP